MTLNHHVPEELVNLAAPGSVEADQYRTLRQAIEQLRREAGSRVFAVTSPGPGEGKTVTALNLSAALGQNKDGKVLLVDADLHRASIAAYLGLDFPDGPGFAELLNDDRVTLPEAVRRVPSLNVSVLLPGGVQTSPYDLLASPRLERVLAEARRLFDFVLIDTPPIVPLPDGRLLSRWVDGYLIVVAADRTSRALLTEALTVLDPAKVAGLVLNGDKRRLGSYYRRSRYGARGLSHVADQHGSWWQRLFARGH